MQLYKCLICSRQFRSGLDLTSEQVWNLYLNNKQTIAEISQNKGVSVSTIKRRLQEVEIDWKQPCPNGSGVVHIDVTYFGRNTGVIIALESGSGRLLYMKHIGHEQVADYQEAVSHIQSCGYQIRGVVVDGFQPLFNALSAFPIQMCQFHLVALVRRKLTKNPQLTAGKELLSLIYQLKNMDKASFVSEFQDWKQRWALFLKEKTIHPLTGRSSFTHQRLRSAMTSISYYLDWLFTFEQIAGMPNTNNLVEGTFTDLKRNLHNHPGMTAKNRRRFINGFFLAYAKLHNKKGDNS